MTKLGIIGAMDVEVAALRSAMEHMEVTTRAGMEFAQGELEGLPAVVVQCGVGKVNAALCVQILCDCFDVTHVVNTGIAGSLDAGLDIGDIVVSQDVMYHDFDCSVFVSYTKGQVPGMPVAFPADEMLMAYAFSAAEKVNLGHTKVGRIASGDQFIGGKAKKEEIVALTKAACTEMEGAAIAHAAYRNGTPFVILRAISDKADESSEMDYPTFEAIAAQRCAEVTKNLARMIRESEEE